MASFGQITDFAKGKKIAIFLDYDGTLSPIVDDPDRALMADDVRKTIIGNVILFHLVLLNGSVLKYITYSDPQPLV